MRRPKENLPSKKEPKEETKVIDKPKKNLSTKARGKTNFFNKNSKFFLINFEKMYVVSDCNRINVMTAREFSIIDVRLLFYTLYLLICIG